MRGESEGERSSARLALLANLISVKVNSVGSKAFVKIGSVSKSLYLVLMIPIIKSRVEPTCVSKPAAPVKLFSSKCFLRFFFLN